MTSGDSEMVELLDEQQTTAHRPHSSAPALPIEMPLVRAVRSLEALKRHADLALLLLEHTPRDQVAIFQAINDAVAAVNGASQAHWEFQSIRTCEGQA